MESPGLRGLKFRDKRDKNNPPRDTKDQTLALARGGRGKSRRKHRRTPRSVLLRFPERLLLVETGCGARWSSAAPGQAVLRRRVSLRLVTGRGRAGGIPFAAPLRGAGIRTRTHSPLKIRIGISSRLSGSGWKNGTNPALLGELSGKAHGDTGDGNRFKWLLGPARAPFPSPACSAGKGLREETLG